MSLLLVAVLAAVALAEEPAPPPEVHAPEPAPALPAAPVEGCTTVRNLPGLDTAGGVPALEAHAAWSGDRLALTWLPRGAAQVRVHVTDADDGRGRLELVCVVADDGALTLGPDRLVGLTSGRVWSFAVVQELPATRTWSMPWLAVAGPVNGPAPLRDVDRTLRRDLLAVRAFAGVGGAGAVWGTALGPVNATIGVNAPALGTGIAAGSSLPLEAMLIGADVSLRRAHRRLAVLGRTPSKRRLLAGEALQYSGLGLQFVSAVAMIGLTGQDRGWSVGTASALGAFQTVGSALQLGAAVTYAVEEAHLRRLLPAVRPAADGATMGVQGTF